MAAKSKGKTLWKVVGIYRRDIQRRNGKTLECLLLNPPETKEEILKLLKANGLRFSDFTDSFWNDKEYFMEDINPGKWKYKYYIFAQRKRGSDTLIYKVEDGKLKELIL
ncbi:MAG: hypothetical protein ACPLYF_03935 [Fervidobacterium sp.]